MIFFTCGFPDKRTTVPVFLDLQTAPRLLRCTNSLPNSQIIPFFVLHILHSKVLIHTIWPSGLTSPREPLSPYFEARPTTFHTWPFLGISFADHRVGGFRKSPIPSRCFLCLPTSHFFPSICNKYTTCPETCIKDLARKWDIYYGFEYISPSFPSSILNQIPVSLSLVLYLSCYLVVFSENV